MGAKSERALILRTRVLGDMGDTIGDCSPEPSTSELSSSAARATAKALMWLDGALNQHCSEHPLAAAYRTLRQRSPHPSRRRAERYWCAFQERLESRVGRGTRLGFAGFDRRPKKCERDFPILFIQWESASKMHPPLQPALRICFVFTWPVLARDRDQEAGWQSNPVVQALTSLVIFIILMFMY